MAEGKWEQDYGPGLGETAKSDCVPDYAKQAEELRERLLVSADLAVAIRAYVTKTGFRSQRSNSLRELYGHLLFENDNMESKVNGLIALADKQAAKNNGES